MYQAQGRCFWAHHLRSPCQALWDRLVIIIQHIGKQAGE